MKKETTQILKKLGFKNPTGNIWKHEVLGIIRHFDDRTEPIDVAIDIFDSGKIRMRNEIKELLDIKH